MIGQHTAALIHLGTWQPLAALSRQQTPDNAAQVIPFTGSLTQLLRHLSHQNLQVRPLDQRYRRTANPRQPLLQQRQTTTLTRDVLLCNGITPWVYARTEIPASTLTGEERCLVHLGRRPLGEYLFNHPRMRRGAIEVRHHQGYWARRSIFWLNNKPLRVTECFLPSFLTLDPQQVRAAIEPLQK